MVTLDVSPLPPSQTSDDVSPSQATTFVECKRKWGFRYIDGIKAPQNRYALLGERVHKVLEDWLKYAMAPDLYEPFETTDKSGKVVTHYPGRIAYAGMHHLPPPGTPMDVEFKFRFRGWTGMIDLGYEKTHDTHGRIHVVHDHKTTTNLGYAKTPEDLKTDAQGLIYAMVALEASGADRVLDQWVYYQTREPYKSAKTELLMTRTMCEDGMVFWEDQASMIRHLKKTVSKAMDLEPSPDMCDRYGGCPYRDSGDCQLTDDERVKGYFMAEMSIAERIEQMKAQKAAGGVQVSPPAHIPMPQIPALPAQAQAALAQTAVPQIPDLPQSQPAAPALPSPQQPSAEDPLDRMAASLKPGQFFLPAGFPPELKERAAARGLGIVEQNGVLAVVAADVVKMREGAINPPEQPSVPVLNPEQQTAAASAPEEEPDTFEAMDKHDLEKFIEAHNLPIEVKKGQQAKTIRKAVRAAWKDRQTLAANPQLAQTTPPATQTQATPPQIPSIPMQVTPPPIPPIPAIPTQATPPPIPAIPTPAPSIPEAVQQHVDQRQLTIQDYAQSSGSYTQAPQEVQRAVAHSETYAGPRMRLFIDCMALGDAPVSVREAFSEVFDALHQAQGVPDYRMVEYGKGPGMLVAGIRHYLETARVEHGNVFISMSSPEGQILRDVLVEHADEVYVGTR